MKKLIIFLATIVLMQNALAERDIKKVYISQTVSHPALDVTAQGIIEGLKQSGYIEGQNIIIHLESAQGNVSLASQIAAKFINQNADVVVGIGTVAAQSFLKYTQENKAKLVFSSITDPLQAGLANKDSFGANQYISGVSNFMPLEPQIEIFKKIQPKIKKLGILYNSGEINSFSIISILKLACNKFDIILVPQSINKTSDTMQAAIKLAMVVDAIFISNDNTALSALQSIIKVANKARIPVYVSDTDAVKFGALAALGPNQYQIGLQTAQMIAYALNGENSGTLKIQFPNKAELYINKDAAAIIDIKLPEEIIIAASNIIQKEQKQK